MHIQKLTYFQVTLDAHVGTLEPKLISTSFLYPYISFKQFREFASACGILDVVYKCIFVMRVLGPVYKTQYMVFSIFHRVLISKYFGYLPETSFGRHVL